MDSGYADIGLENTRSHLRHEKPRKRVLNQAQEFGLHPVGTVIKGCKVVVVNYTSVKLKRKCKEATCSNLYFRKIILAAVWLMDLKKPNLGKRDRLEDY